MRDATQTSIVVSMASTTLVFFSLDDFKNGRVLTIASFAFFVFLRKGNRCWRRISGPKITCEELFASLGLIHTYTRISSSQRRNLTLSKIWSENLEISNILLSNGGLVQ